MPVLLSHFQPLLKRTPLIRAMHVTDLTPVIKSKHTKIVPSSQLTVLTALTALIGCLHDYIWVAYGGYGVINGGYHNDGQFAQGRLAMGLHLLQNSSLNYGVELGLQSGNTMRLSASSSLIASAGGLPIQATLKPII